MMFFRKKQKVTFEKIEKIIEYAEEMNLNVNLSLAKIIAMFSIHAGLYAIQQMKYVVFSDQPDKTDRNFKNLYKLAPEGYFDDEDWIRVYTLYLLFGEAVILFKEAVNRYELQIIQASMYQPFYELYPELDWLEHSLQQTDLREEEIGNTEIIAQLLNAKYEEKADEFFND